MRGNLAKSQAPTKGAKVRFDEKSEGEIILPTAPIGNLSRKVNRFEESSFLDTIVAGKTSKEKSESAQNWLPLQDSDLYSILDTSCRW